MIKYHLYVIFDFFETMAASRLQTALRDATIKEKREDP